jgi:D-alanyl-D-alanine carboxypeptidase
LFITALVVLAVLLIGLSAVQPTKGGISGDDTSNGTGSIVAVDGSNIADTHMLALVNRDHQVSADFAPPDLVDASPVLPVDTVAEKLNATALEALVKMIGDADDAISGGLMLLSGYRSYDQQEQTYSAAEDKSYVQTPGSSEHEIGLAADISMDDGTGLSPSAVGWLAEHSWEYGFILRYPQGQHAQESTGISYEPWHFRYVGEPHAWYCTKHGITFEEYVDMLKSKGGYTATLDNL